VHPFVDAPGGFYVRMYVTGAREERNIMCLYMLRLTSARVLN